MATYSLTFKKHWNFYIKYRKDLPYVEPQLNSDILKWLSKNKIRNTPSFDVLQNYQASICILNPKDAILFKLTWM